MRMKGRRVLCLALGTLVLGLGVCMAGTIMVADFDSGTKPNNINGDFGAWQKDPTDMTQGCWDSLVSDVRHGTKGYALKLVYDVDSPNPAYNGFWMKLNNLNIDGYKNLVFHAKGDEEKGFTRRFKVELKNATQVGSTIIEGLTSQWQRIVVPLSAFGAITDWTAMTEFVIVFDDLTSMPKEGVIYIDNVMFTDGTDTAAKASAPAAAEAPKTTGLPIIRDVIGFPSGGAAIAPQQEAALARVAKIIKDTPDARVLIKGYSDSMGSMRVNMDVSRRRAEAVSQALVSRHGIPKGRLQTVGYGPESPIASNDTPQGRAKNRRVEFSFIK